MLVAMPLRDGRDFLPDSIGTYVANIDWVRGHMSPDWEALAADWYEEGLVPAKGVVDGIWQFATLFHDNLLQSPHQYAVALQPCSPWLERTWAEAGLYHGVWKQRFVGPCATHGRDHGYLFQVFRKREEP
jgi:hypothetical protein